MGIGQDKTTGHIKGFKQEIGQAANVDRSTFFNWFDESGGDLETNYTKGQCDFSLYVQVPLLPYIKNRAEKTILEIGYGGGRLLAAAAASYKKAIGVDIHDQIDMVKEELSRRNISNITLLKTAGDTLPVPDNSVDVVYSFIVLQHVEKISVFNSYLQETYRALNKGGYAVLFYGRPFQFSEGRNSRLLLFIDKLLERLTFTRYKELLAKVNCTNLTVSRRYMHQKLKSLGFSILDSGVSRKLPHVEKYGGQYYVVVQK